MPARVSIVMPVRNPGPFLEAAIQSVLQQTYKDWQLIVIDDGSDKPLQESLRQYQNVTVIRQPAIGVSAARNLGIVSSTSEYIAFLDSDDIWFPTKLQEQVSLMDSEPALGMCYTNRNVIDAHGLEVVQPDKKQASPGDTAPPTAKPSAAVFSPSPANRDTEAIAFVCQQRITTSTVMIRRETLAVTGLFDVMLKYNEDYDMWIKIARFFGCAHITSVQASYRWHGNNSVSSYQAALIFDREMYRKYDRLANFRNDKQLRKIVRSMQRTARAEYARIAFEHCRGCLRMRNLSGFLLHMVWAARLDLRFVGRSLHLWCREHGTTSA